MLNFRVDLHAIDATPTHAWSIPTRLGAVAAVRELRVARRPREEALPFRAAVAEEREAEAVVVRDDAGAPAETTGLLARPKQYLYCPGARQLYHRRKINN